MSRLVAHVVVDGPAQVLAAADVELAVVQRAGEDPALQRALVERRVLVAAATAHGVDVAVVLAEADLAVLGAHVLHAAAGDVVELRYFVPHGRPHPSSGGNCGRLSGSVTSWWTNSPHQQRFIVSKCSRWNGMHGQHDQHVLGAHAGAPLARAERRAVVLLQLDLLLEQEVGQLLVGRELVAERRRRRARTGSAGTPCARRCPWLTLPSP